MIWPSPPPLTNAASVAVATTCTAAVRNPAARYGTASGSSTRRSTCPPDRPMPARRVPGLRVDLPHPGVRVGQQRRHREDRQRDHHRPAGRSRAKVSGRMVSSASVGMARVRLDDQRPPRRRPGRVCPSQSPIGQATRQPSSTAAARDPQVLAEPVQDPAGIGPVQRVVEPDDRLLGRFIASARAPLIGAPRPRGEQPAEPGQDRSSTRASSDAEERAGHDLRPCRSCSGSPAKISCRGRRDRPPRRP